jgi:hypothetical protein
MAVPPEELLDGIGWVSGAEVPEGAITFTSRSIAKRPRPAINEPRQ